MKFTTVFASLFIGAALAADANSVTSKINALQTQTQTLDNDIKKFNGGLLGIPAALQIQVDSVNVLFAAIDITNEANAVGQQLDSAGSAQVTNAVRTLVPVVQNSLKDLQGKRTTFADLSPLALASLYQLRQVSAQFAGALSGLLQGDDLNNALDLYVQADNAFKAAIVTYGGVAGDI